MGKRILGVWLILLGVLFGVGRVGRAAPIFQVEQPRITYPADGATVSGVVEVRGSATHPNLDFYQVRYAPGAGPTADSQWQDFAIVEGRRVENDVLGTWDTTQLPDGPYTLALAVWGVNDANSPYLDFATNLVVDNTDPVVTPTPTAEPDPEPTEVLPTPTIGPTPTPMTVEQPPTVTPRPTATLSPGLVETPTVAPDEGADLALSVGQIRTGFCVGGLFSVVLLALWGLYVTAKAGLRWILRQRSTSSSGTRR